MESQGWGRINIVENDQKNDLYALVITEEEKDMIKITGTLIVCVILFYGSGSLASQKAHTESGHTQKSITTIAEDIKLLSGKGKSVSEAAERLISRGSTILVQTHRALENPETTAQQKWALILILANLSDQSSIHSILKVAEKNQDKRTQRSVLRSIKKFTRNKEIESYVYKVLNNKKNDIRVLRAALDYLADNANANDKQWAEQYSALEYDLKIRSTALYLGGMLGIEAFKDKIIETFKKRKKPTGEVHMLMGLTELTTPDEFNTLIKTDGIHLRHENIAAARHHYFLRHGDQQQKSLSASEVLHKGPGFLKYQAISYLIESRNAEALSHSWLRGDKAVKHMVQKEGLTILVDEHGARFEKNSNKSVSIQTAQHMQENVEKPPLDEFYRAIFSSLKNKDKLQFKSLAILTDAEFARHIATIAPDYKQKSGMIKQYKDQFKKSQEIILDSWNEIYRKGIQNNINWATARYVASDKQTEKYAYNKIFLMSQKGYYYKISVPTTIFIEGKWKLQSQLHWRGSKMRQDEAGKWSELAADANDAISEKELQILNNRTQAGKADVLRMLSSYENILAQYELYTILKVSVNKTDKSEALDWLIRSALNKYSKAQYELSEALNEKWHISKSQNILESSKNNLLLSANQNYIFALKKVAEHYSNGTGGFDMDLSRSITYYNKILKLDRASLGTAEANAYIFFERDIQDKIKQISSQNKGLEVGDPKALTMKALQQLEFNTIKNKQNGLKLLSQAADSGYPEAQYQLGKIYAKGNEVVKQNPEKAVALWRKASEKDQIESIEELATGYIKGKYGLKENPKQALPLADRLATYYVKHSKNHKGNAFSARVWRVHACNLEMEIARKKDPAFVVPRVKTGRCKGL